ncbi:MAG: formate dehydrogenase accessory sulfurtransferase FdhD [Thermoplasmata archaeon]
MSASRGGSSTRIRVGEVRAARLLERNDEVAAEEPLEIRVVVPDAGEPRAIAVTMRTPGHDFELAAGFLLSEGLLREREEIAQIAYCTDPAHPQQFNQVNVHLRRGVPVDFDRFRRNVFTSSSCGICGKATLEHVRTVVSRAPVGRFRLASALLESLPERALRDQKLFDRTGGLHASALFDPAGELLVLREDVGRHNALDKVVGQQLLAGRLPASDTVLLVSGRASFELVQKAAVAGIPFLAAIGAPSSLAVELARDQGMTLVGFLREGRYNVYAGPQRLAV